MFFGITMIGMNEFQSPVNPQLVYAATSKPTVTITSHLPGSSILAGNIVVQGTTSDIGSSVKYVTASVNGSGIVTATPKSPGDWSTWSVTLLSQYPGKNTIRAKVVDNAGNVKWTFVQVTGIDKTPRPSTSTPVPFVFIVRTYFPDMTNLISIYHKHAKTSDIVEEFSNQTLANTVVSAVPSMKGVTYFNLKDIQNNVIKLHNSGYTWVIYDLEPEYSPANEVADPLGSVQQAAKLVHNNGMKLMIAPALIPRSYVQSMTSYTDGYLIQAQDMINDPITSFTPKITSLINLIRTEKANEVIIMQGSTIKDNAIQINAAYDVAKNMINGVTVFYNQTSDLPTIATVLTHVDGIS